MSRMYVRFVIAATDPTSHQPRGVFQAIHDLLGSGHLGADDFKRVREDLDWFNHHLDAPKYKIHPRAIFWFRSRAENCTRRMWKFVQLLRIHGTQVEMITTRDPGEVVYFDEHQIAAMPPRPRHRKKR